MGLGALALSGTVRGQIPSCPARYGMERLCFQALWLRGYLRVLRQGMGFGYLSAFVPGSPFYLQYPRSHSA